MSGTNSTVSSSSSTTRGNCRRRRRGRGRPAVAACRTGACNQCGIAIMSLMIISFFELCHCFLRVPMQQPVSISMARSWSSKGFSTSSSSSSSNNDKFRRSTTLARTAGDQQTQDGQEEVGVPHVLRDTVLETIKDLGGGKVKEVKETTPGPGLHNRHFRYTATGGTFFAKVSKDSLEDNFIAERAGLEAIIATGTLRAPKPLAHGKLPLGGSFLLMEHMPFIPFGQSIPEVLKHLAEGLAEMHLRDLPSDVQGFGFASDNFLGMSPQRNAWRRSLTSFMVENRLLPLFEKACEKFSTNYGTSNEDASAFQSMGAKIFERAKDVFEPVSDSEPSLLHGDLWVGNCGGVPAEGGAREAAVFDPACWYGPHEFDLALATMFGGFGEPFYETYHAIIPKAEGFDQRMRFYKLYHYLNHLNLHGAGFGHGGTVEAPRGYFERTVGLMQDIVADG